MNKEEWEELYDKLDRIHGDFLMAYPEYTNGRNKKIRENAEKKVKNAIELAERYILKNHEAYLLLTGEDNTDYGRAIVYEEFTRSNYFGKDMYEFLDNIKKKIISFED